MPTLSSALTGSTPVCLILKYNRKNIILSHRLH